MAKKNVNPQGRDQELKKSSTVTGPAETSVGTQDKGKNIGGREAGGPAGTGGVSTNDVGSGRGPGKSPGKSIETH